MGDTSLETTLTKGSPMLRRRGNMLNYQVIWKATVLCHTCVFHDVLCFGFTNGYNKVPIGHGFSYQACIMFLSMYQPYCSSNMHTNIQTFNLNSIHAITTKRCVKSCRHLNTTNTHDIWLN